MIAPWFEGQDQNGNTISLKSFEGKNILLYFYPKDDTLPCINQACSLREGYVSLMEKNIVVVGVSADNQLSHSVFAEQHHLPFSLLADTELKTIKAYDVWGLKNIAGRHFEGIVRTSFIIGADSTIKHIVFNPNTKNDAKEIIALFE